VVELGLEHIAADGQPLAPGEHHPVALALRPAIDRRRVAARIDEDEVRPIELDASLDAGDNDLWERLHHDTELVKAALKPSHYTHLPPLYPIVLSDEHRERADELGEAGV